MRLHGSQRAHARCDVTRPRKRREGHPASHAAGESAPDSARGPGAGPETAGVPQDEARWREARPPSRQSSPVSGELSADGWVPRSRLRTAVGNESGVLLRLLLYCRDFGPLLAGKRPSPRPPAPPPGPAQAGAAGPPRSALLFGDELSAPHTLPGAPLRVVLSHLLKCSWLRSKMHGLSVPRPSSPGPGTGSGFGRTSYRNVSEAASSGSSPGVDGASACRGKA